MRYLAFVAALALNVSCTGEGKPPPPALMYSSHYQLSSVQHGNCQITEPESLQLMLWQNGGALVVLDNGAILQGDIGGEDDSLAVAGDSWVMFASFSESLSLVGSMFHRVDGCVGGLAIVAQEL